MNRSFGWMILSMTCFVIATLGTAPESRAINYSWTQPSDGSFLGLNNWTPNGVPGPNDTATFSRNDNTYVSVDCGGHPTVLDLTVSAGRFNFGAFSADESLSVDPTDGSAISILQANGATNAEFERIAVRTPHLDVENGANVFAYNDSVLTIGRDGMNLASPNANCILNGTLTLQGATLNETSTTVFQRDVDQYVGTNGGTGALEFQVSTGNFIGGPLLIAADVTSGTGDVGLSQGSILSVAGNITMATNSQSSQTATLYVDGAGSALTQQDKQFSGTGIYIGSAANGSAGIYVGTLVSGGTLSTGSAGLTIYKTGFVNVGTSTTTGTLNANGDVNIDGGILFVGEGSQFNLAAGATLTINGGAADFLAFNPNGSKVNFVAGEFTYPGNLLVGTGGLLGNDVTLASNCQITINGTGVATIDPSHSLTVSGGTLNAKSLTINGTLNANAGSVHLTGDATFAAASAMHVGLSGTTHGDQYGFLRVGSSIGFNGTLQVTLVGGFLPMSGYSFDIFDFTTHTGAFSSLQLPALASGLNWDTSQLYVTGVLSVAGTVIGVAGDYNGNGFVDAADYIAWRNNQGTTHILPNDPIGGVIGAAQYNQWRSHFGQTAGSGAGAIANAAVPEPSTIGVTTMAVAGLSLRRRRAT